jgi:hypothetical protein
MPRYTLMHFELESTDRTNNSTEFLYDSSMEMAT